MCDLGQEQSDSANQLFEWEATELEVSKLDVFVEQGKDVYKSTL